MKRYLKPETINILGGSQAAGYQANHHGEHPSQPEPEPSRWEKFKSKATRIWNTFMGVAREIKDTILPIVTGMGTLLAGLAAFRSSNHNNYHSHNHNQHGGDVAWAR